MKDYLAYVSLPPVPEHLIEPIQEIIDKPRKGDSKVLPFFTPFVTKETSKELVEWANDTFKRECYIQYQVVRKGLPIHYDANQRRVAFNYILQTGGENASICFYNKDKTLVFSEPVKEKVWHRIKVDSLHTVTNIDTIRVGIGVMIPSYIWGDPEFDL